MHVLGGLTSREGGSVLTGLQYTTFHSEVEDGIRAIESIPKANCSTSTHHISYSLIPISSHYKLSKPYEGGASCGKVLVL